MKKVEMSIFFILFYLYIKIELSLSSEYYNLNNEQLKTKIRPKSIEDSWQKITQKLKKQIIKFETQQQDCIPEISFKRISSNGFKLPIKTEAKFRSRGVLVIRNILEEEYCQKLLADLLKYLADLKLLKGNGNLYKTKTSYAAFWSKSQVELRQHPNILGVGRAMLNLLSFKLSNVSDSFRKPIISAKAVRIVHPRTLDEHLSFDFKEDPIILPGNGIDRWDNKDFQYVYSEILKAQFDKYDPFEVDDRIKAEKNSIDECQNFYGAFNGWMSLSAIGVNEGGLKVFPSLVEGTFYWYLRPFLHDIPESVFPGVSPGKPLTFSSKYHPLIYNHMVPLPTLYPGDLVLWHEDAVLQEESINFGSKYSAIIPLSIGPNCLKNKNYARKLGHAFLLNQYPPNFPSLNEIVGESKLKASPLDLTDEGRKNFNWKPYSKRLKNLADKTCLKS